MLVLKTFRIAKHERGLFFRNGDFETLLSPGRHLYLGATWKTQVEIVSMRDVVFEHKQLDVMVRSGQLTRDSRSIEVGGNQRAFVWVDGTFARMLMPGRYVLWTALHEVSVELVDTRKVHYQNADIENIVRSGVLAGQAMTVDLTDNERALIWVDGRFETILSKGLHVLWTLNGKRIEVERVDATKVRFEHGKLNVILDSKGVEGALNGFVFQDGEVGVAFIDGRNVEVLKPGVYAFWRGGHDVKIVRVSLKEQTLDISGQEIMTADKVTLRLNVVLTYVVEDPVKFVGMAQDASQALYREAQLALRETVGAREIDRLLSDKEQVARELEARVSMSGAELGVKVRSLGIRDVILPGEMKDLLNKVIEAKKAAEATLITRREETAAARMQANTAKILNSSPELMRMRELEALEKVSQKANLTVLLGEGGLAQRVTKML